MPVIFQEWGSKYIRNKLSVNVHDPGTAKVGSVGAMPHLLYLFAGGVLHDQYGRSGPEFSALWWHGDTSHSQA